jgi:cell wall-associated NlpC family hydrolase
VSVGLQQWVNNHWVAVQTRSVPGTGTVSFAVSPNSTRSYRVMATGGSRAYSGNLRVTVTPAARVVAHTVAYTVSTNVSPRVATVLAEAQRMSGRPYVFGAAGPSAFDCSGLTQWVFRKVGISLPHNADMQQHYGRAVSRAEMRPGDLLFFRTGSYAYHVAIFAGNGYMYEAPNPSETVGKHRIWSDSYVVRRLLG